MKETFTTQMEIKNLKALSSSIAHEVRSPLASIQQGCNIIKGSLNEAIEFLDLIDISAQRGLMISELILANIKTNQINTANFTSISASTIVKKAIKAFAFESQKERSLINLNLKNDFYFKGDETLAIFIIFNLLKNSLFYKTKINIWLDNKNKLLHFKDYGVGIEEAKLKNIFDDFFTSGKKSGTGLGLPFCKKVMRAFNGDIYCKSIIGEFSEFILDFKNNPQKSRD